MYGENLTPPLCEPGTYCPGGNFNMNTCEAGKYLLDNECEKYPVGYYSTG